MKNIELIELEKYKNLSNYKNEETGVYVDLNDTDNTRYRIALSFELEEGENEQYPIEDILDKYYLHVSHFLGSIQDSNKLKLELAGELEDIREIKDIIGKRVYNKSFTVDGKAHIKLIID